MIHLLMALEDALAGEPDRAGRPLPADTLEDKVRRIQAGDDDLRNQVISDCLPYVKGVLNRMLAQPMIEQADEFSVALSAFNEAIDRYRVETHVPFLRFAGLVINRRVIDWLRRQRQHQHVRPFSDYAASPDESPETVMDTLVHCPADSIWQNMEIEEEIVLLQQQLQRYGLSISRLARDFPRHRDSRLMCLEAARLTRSDTLLHQRFTAEGRLPAAELSRRSGIPLKTIERNRPFIIFLVLLLDSGLEVIKSYLSAYGRGT